MSDLLTNVRKELGADYDGFSKEQQHALLITMMEKLIERKILLKQAEDAKDTPTPADVENFIASLDRQLGNTSTVRKELEKHGAEEIEFKNRLREELAIKKYLDHHVFSAINVGSAEIEAELNKNADKYKVSKEVCARYIELKIPKDASPEQVLEIEKKIKSALALVLDNHEFSDVAREFSQAANRLKGGDLGCFTENQLPSEFTKVAFALAAGKVSEVIRAPNAFMFLRVDKIKQLPDFTPAEKKEKAEQVLLRVELHEARPGRSWRDPRRATRRPGS